MAGFFCPDNTHAKAQIAHWVHSYKGAPTRVV